MVAALAGDYVALHERGVTPHTYSYMQILPTWLPGWHAACRWRCEQALSFHKSHPKAGDVLFWVYLFLKLQPDDGPAAMNMGSCSVAILQRQIMTSNQRRQDPG